MATENPVVAALIARAIVHLNFNHPEKAHEVLCLALTEINFPRKLSNAKENTDGNPAAA